MEELKLVNDLKEKIIEADEPKIVEEVINEEDGIVFFGQCH